jgi:hypothetical protein
VGVQYSTITPHESVETHSKRVSAKVQEKECHQDVTLHVLRR